MKLGVHLFLVMQEFRNIKIVVYQHNINNKALDNIVNLLRVYGFNIIVTDSENSLIAKISKKKYDLLIIDSFKIDASLWDLMSEIRLNTNTNYIPIINAGVCGEEYQLFAIKKGANYCFCADEPINNLIIKIEACISYMRNLVGALRVFEEIRDKQKNEGDYFLKQIKRVIYDGGIANDLTHEFIAQQMNLSRSSLQRKVKTYTNSTLSDIYLIVKVDLALKMLKVSNPSIETIAANLGFKSSSYFATIFKKYTKVTPTEYKKTGTVTCTPLFYKIQEL